MYSTGQAALKKNILHTLSELPAQKMRVALDFLEYLREKDVGGHATAEILGNRRLMSGIRAARRDWTRGKEKKFVSWHKMRRDV